MATRLEDVRNAKIEKYKELVNKFYDPFKLEKYNKTHFIADVRKKYEKINENSDDLISTTGRIIAIRGHGKLQFLDLKDSTGEIQIILRADNLKEFEIVKFISIGDIIGIKGNPIKTRSGALSIQVNDLTILSKNIMPLPEKWHGLQDQEIRYRKRYVDFIMNPDAKKAVEIKANVIRYMREYLFDKGFLEVETPTLHSIAGGANAKPFVTHHNSLDIDLYLRIAPELYLKRLIAGGFEKIFEIGKNFRNEGIDFKHNPEFTSMELYWAYSDYKDIIKITEEIISHIIKKLSNKENVVYDEKEINFRRPWKIATMTELVKEETGIDFDKIDEKEALELARKNNIEVPYDTSKGNILAEFFDEFVEKTLINPTFVIKHPVETSPLAKKDPENPKFTNRFELYINGWEIANAFSELNDPFDQYDRFKRQMELKAKGDEEANDIDYDYIEALETGLPPTGGLGIGIDRLAMLIADVHSIRDVLAFPLLRPEETTLQKILENKKK